MVAGGFPRQPSRSGDLSLVSRIGVGSWAAFNLCLGLSFLLRFGREEKLPGAVVKGPGSLPGQSQFSSRGWVILYIFFIKICFSSFSHLFIILFTSLFFPFSSFLPFVLYTTPFLIFISSLPPSLFFSTSFFFPANFPLHSIPPPLLFLL